MGDSKVYQRSVIGFESARPGQSVEEWGELFECELFQKWHAKRR